MKTEENSKNCYRSERKNPYWTTFLNIGKYLLYTIMTDTEDEKVVEVTHSVASTNNFTRVKNEREDEKDSEKEYEGDEIAPKSDVIIEMAPSASEI